MNYSYHVPSNSERELFKRLKRTETERVENFLTEGEKKIIEEKEIKERFLSSSVNNCHTCGNKVKPKYIRVNDMNANFEAPSVGCSYCETGAGCFWPGQEDLCIEAWNSKK